MFFVTLQNRGLIHLEGADRHRFLQDLITNDINKLSAANPLYACLLNAQGKFLHDFFVIEGDGFTLLECEGGDRAQDLYSRLTMYRLRADVQISVQDDHAVYAILGQDKAIDLDAGFKDPRHTDIGYRSFNKPDLPEENFDAWDYRRISLTIPDGSRDLEIGHSTLDEGSMDTLNAVDYKKGCYIGQELTARMHYRGLGKRKLMTIGINPADLSPREDGSARDIIALRSSCRDMAIALVRV